MFSTVPASLTDRVLWIIFLFFSPFKMVLCILQCGEVWYETKNLLEVVPSFWQTPEFLQDNSEEASQAWYHSIWKSSALWTFCFLMDPELWTAYYFFSVLSFVCYTEVQRQMFIWPSSAGEQRCLFLSSHNSIILLLFWAISSFKFCVLCFVSYFSWK